MSAAYYVLSVAGIIGAFDVLYFHIYTCRLWTRRVSAVENVTHAVRAVLFAVYFAVILHLDARGAWWWIIPGICTLEFLNSMVDTFLEGASRKDQGGLHHGEYILHVVLTMMMGVISTSMVWDTVPLRLEPTSIGWRTLDVPESLRYGGYFAVALGLAFAAFELSGVARVLLGERGAEPHRA